jgi:ABC-type transport system involved in multi-copper enzyme maturation permease subunit
MIRLAWRQFRIPGVVAAGALLVAAVFAFVTGRDLAHAYSATLAACDRIGDCPSATAAFARTDSALSNAFGVLVTIAPALVGVFWGAPLVAREIEAGTLPLVWTQSVTRTRWLLIKLAVVGLASALAAGLFSLVITWWARPLDSAAATMYATFGQRDIVPIGYALFAFALGVAVGVLVRRTVPAMAVTLFVFVAVRVSTTYGLRPRLFAPEQQILALDPVKTGFGSAISPSILLNSLFYGGPTSALDPETPTIANAWMYPTRVVDAQGHDLTDAVLNATCPDIAAHNAAPPTVPGHVPVSESAQEAARACVSTVGATYHELVTYQPASRYWAFQWAEVAIYAGSAVLLGAACLWWVRRRISGRGGGI